TTRPNRSIKYATARQTARRARSPTDGRLSRNKETTKGMAQRQRRIPARWAILFHSTSWRFPNRDLAAQVAWVSPIFGDLSNSEKSLLTWSVLAPSLQSPQVPTGPLSAQWLRIHRSSLLYRSGIDGSYRGTPLWLCWRSLLA